MDTIKTLLAAALLLWAAAAHAGLPIQHWQSASGAQVYFVENHDLPIVDLSVGFAAGSGRLAIYFFTQRGLLELRRT